MNRKFAIAIGSFSAILVLFVLSLFVNRKPSIKKIYSNGRAFAAVTEDGSVVTWGKASSGGDSSSVADQLKSGVKVIYSTNSAFAAIKKDGSIVTWGRPALEIQLCSRSAEEWSQDDLFQWLVCLRGLKGRWFVISWGNKINGGDSSSVAAHLKRG